MKNITPPRMVRPINPMAISAQWIMIGACAIVVLWLFLTGLTQVPPDSKGVLTRFGRYKATLNPGLHIKIPFGVDRIEMVRVERQQKLEFGYGTDGASNPDQVPDENDAQNEREMVTGDLNMAVLEWVVQYRVEDPKQYLFHVFKPEWTLRDVGEAVMREVVGDRTIDEVLTTGRGEMEREAMEGMQAACKRYGLGLQVNQIQLQNVNPPRAVQSSFNEVNQAQQEMKQMVNVATGEYNKVIPRAKGDAIGRVSEAEGYAMKRVNEAQGDADRFNTEFAAYSKAPEITRQRLYLEAMRQVMPMLERKIILDEGAGKVLPLLQLDTTQTKVLDGRAKQ